MYYFSIWNALFKGIIAIICCNKTETSRIRPTLIIMGNTLWYSVGGSVAQDNPSFNPEKVHEAL